MKQNEKKIDRRTQKNEIRQETIALVIIDSLIIQESDPEKKIKLQSARKEVSKLCKKEL